MTKISLYTIKGNKGRDIEFPKELIGKKNIRLLSQALRVYEGRNHPGTSKVKTRGEVKISTRKIYRQKGTGFARHGAKSAPIFVGGGIAHGPKGVKRVLKLPKGLRKNALKTALAYKLSEGMILAIDKLDSLSTTKEAQELVNNIVVKTNTKNSKVLMVSDGKNENIRKAVRNIPNVKCENIKNLNVNKVYFADILLFDKSVLIAKSSESKTERSLPKKSTKTERKTDKQKTYKKSKITGKTKKSTKKPKSAK